MKYTSYIKFTLAAVLTICSVAAFAQKAQLNTNVTRAVTLAQRQQQATVIVTSTLQKAIKMSDKVCRPLRGCKDQVISYETKTNTCKGTLDQSGKRIYVTADCVSKSGYTLSGVKLKFANGKVGTGTEHAVSVKEDVASIAVSPALTRGLQGFTFAAIPQGKSLRDMFGTKIENFLLSFFHQNGVPERRKCRIGSSLFRTKPTIKEGDPVIYQGKVIALVKDVPYTFRRGAFGKVSEDALAIIRS